MNVQRKCIIDKDKVAVVKSESLVSINIVPSEIDRLSFRHDSTVDLIMTVNTDLETYKINKHKINVSSDIYKYNSDLSIGFKNFKNWFNSIVNHKKIIIVSVSSIFIILLILIITILRNKICLPVIMLTRSHKELKKTGEQVHNLKNDSKEVIQTDKTDKNSDIFVFWIYVKI